jgi:hypothetical protein
MIAHTFPSWSHKTLVFSPVASFLSFLFPSSHDSTPSLFRFRTPTPPPCHSSPLRRSLSPSRTITFAPLEPVLDAHTHPQDRTPPHTFSQGRAFPPPSPNDERLRHGSPFPFSRTAGRAPPLSPPGPRTHRTRRSPRYVPVLPVAFRPPAGPSAKTRLKAAPSVKSFRSDACFTRVL